MKKIVLGLSVLVLAIAAFGTVTVSVKTADYAIVPADNGNIIIMNSASARVFTLPSISADSVGFSVTLQKRGAGNVTVQAQAADYIADSGVGQYVRNTTATETYASITLAYTQTNRWQIMAASGTWSTDVSTMTFGAGLTAALALKAPLASPTFTGTFTLPVGLTGYVKAATGVVSAGAIADGDLPATIKGLTLAAVSTGFTLAGGTTSKTATIDADITASTVNTHVALGDGSAHGAVPTNTANMIVRRGASGELVGGTVNGSTIIVAADAALASDGVLTTTIAAGIAGVLMVKEATALNQYFLMTPTAVGGALMTNTAYSATKDNALTVNVYVESGVVKVQNKTAAAINVKIGIAGIL
jgi:hypothetical protein